jgi:hypothetical protein
MDLAIPGRGIGEQCGVAGMSLRGDGSTRAASEGRAILSYVWVKYLGRSGRELAG